MVELIREKNLAIDRKRIASLVSHIFNPFLIGLVLIILTSFGATTGAINAIKWSLILAATTILPAFLFVLFLISRNRLDSIFADVRKQRTQIYAAAIVLACMSCIVLFLLSGPLMLRTLAITGLAASVVFLVVNLFWKVSVHTAFITAAVTVLYVLYGAISLVSVTLIFLVGWARLELERHSLAQAVAGTLLSVLITIPIFTLFGFI